MSGSEREPAYGRLFRNPLPRNLAQTGDARLAWNAPPHFRALLSDARPTCLARAASGLRLRGRIFDVGFDCAQFPKLEPKRAPDGWSGSLAQESRAVKTELDETLSATSVSRWAGDVKVCAIAHGRGSSSCGAAR